MVRVESNGGTGAVPVERTPAASRRPALLAAASAAVGAFALLAAFPLAAADPPPSAQGTRQTEAPAVAPESKLDAPLVTALKRSRGELPPIKSGQLDPDIPVSDGTRVLVDVSATATDDLRRHITGIGGRLAPSPEPQRIVRAMVPLAELEALARRADVISIVPAQLSVVRRLETDPNAPGGFSTNSKKP